MSKYSYKFKLKVVLEYIDGDIGYSLLAKKHGVSDHSMIRKWVNNFKIYGDAGLKKSMSHAHYSGEFKLDVLNYRKIYELSYQETANHFGIKQGGTIANWQRTYQTKGFVGLQGSRGRPKRTMAKEKKPDSTKKEASSKSDKEEIKRLKKEIEYLKLQNAYNEAVKEYLSKKN